MNEPIEGLGSFQPVLEAYATDVAHRRSELARVVSRRALDLDDRRAHVCQEHRAVGAGKDARQVDDDDAVQRTRPPVGERSARAHEVSPRSSVMPWTTHAGRSECSISTVCRHGKPA